MLKPEIICFVIILASELIGYSASYISGANPLVPCLNRKYELASIDEDFDRVMELLELGAFARELDELASPVMELTEHNGDFIFSSTFPFKNASTKFRVWEDFEEITPDGRKVQSIIIQNKNKLIEIQNRETKTARITREFTPDMVTERIEVDDIVTQLTYKPL